MFAQVLSSCAPRCFNPPWMLFGHSLLPLCLWSHCLPGQVAGGHRCSTWALTPSFGFFLYFFNSYSNVAFTRISEAASSSCSAWEGKRSRDLSYLNFKEFVF